MGGPGSGSWYRWQSSKATVEEFRAIDAGRWAREGIISPGTTQAGNWAWSRDGEVVARISYAATARGDGTGSVILHYNLGSGEGREPFRYAVDLQATRPHYGGLRWWFVCPLIVGGRPCRRRAGKLYLRGRYFGCRRCHDLTYRSCQEAHQAERAERMLARLLPARGRFDPRAATSGELLAYLRAARAAGR